MPWRGLFKEEGELTMPELRNYLVTLREDADAADTIFFDCQAEDEEHAKEQALNAYPEGEVVEIVIAKDHDGESPAWTATVSTHPLTEKYGITPPYDDGEWHIEDATDSRIVSRHPEFPDDEEYVVCDAESSDAALTEWDGPNLKLIAKAPKMLALLERAIPQLILLGNYIGNEWPGGGGIEAFDRCALIGDVRALLSSLEVKR